MSSASQFPAELDFLLRVSRHYGQLMVFARPAPDPDGEPGLGGQLLYAGKLDEQGSALVVAGNIAGAQSLAASADPAARKQAFRDGVVDFLVNSLDEALRILKNQVRKRETVAVCVALAPETVEREMQDRGVTPDLDSRDFHSLQVDSRHLDSRHLAFSPIEPIQSGAQSAHPAQAQMVWNVDAAPAIWLPKLDAIAIECLPAGAWPSRRWLRLAPRYLGRPAQSRRLLVCPQDLASEFLRQFQQRIELARIGAVVEIQISAPGMCDHYRIAPRAD